MANRSSVVEVLIKARDTTARVVGEFRRRWQAATKVVTDITKAFVTAGVAAAGLVFGLTKLGQQGDKMLGIQAAFARVTDNATAALERLREASGGTISDLDLMARHNQALALGTANSTEEFARMLRVSKALGESLGIDDVEAMEKFTNVVTSGSKRAARELGLEIDAHMSRNQIIEEAEKVVARLAGTTGAGSEAADRFAVAIENAKNKVAVFVAQSPLVAAFFDTLTDAVNGIIGAIGSGDTERMRMAFESLGRIAGNAFAAGLAGAGFGFQPEKQLERIMGNIKAEVEVLRSLGRAPSAAGVGVGGQAPGGGAPLDINVPFRGDMGAGGSWFGQPGLGITPESVARWRASRSDPILASARRMQLNMPQSVSVLGIPEDAALELDDAVGVAVESLGRLGDAAVSESHRMEVALIQSFQSILANIKTKDGLFGSTLLGGVLGVGLGLAAAFAGRDRSKPVPVAIENVSDRAAQQMRERGGPPVNVTNITMLPDGTILSIEQIELELYNRQRRQEPIRLSPRTGRPLTGR